tara:strand:- start:448 stop:2064 length:1617 start_codon:yes stop_codon:yes gene_type:complete
MGTKIFGANKGISTDLVVSDNQEKAINIESSEGGKDLISASTKEGDESVRMVKSQHYAYGDNLNNTPKMTITPQSGQILFDTPAGSNTDFAFRPEGTEVMRINTDGVGVAITGTTKITGPGGTTGLAPSTGGSAPTLYIENSTGSSKDRTTLMMNADGNSGSNIDMYHADNLCLRIGATSTEQYITAEDALVLKAEATDTAMFSVSAASTFSTGAAGTALSGTFTATQGSDAITAGSSTAFTTELHVGATMKIPSSVSGGYETFTVDGITSDTILSLDSNYLGSTRATSGGGLRDSGELFAVKTGDSKTLFSVSGDGVTALAKAAGETVQIGPSGVSDTSYLNLGHTDFSDVRISPKSGGSATFYIKQKGSATGEFYQFYESDGTLAMQLNGSGVLKLPQLGTSSDVQTDGSSQLITSSDSRLKTSTGLIENGLDKILALTPRYFTWNNDESNASQLGFFSQEVNAVCPEAGPKSPKLEAVGFTDPDDEDSAAIFEQATDDDGNPDFIWGLNSRALVALLVKSVQELTARVTTLEAGD